MNNTKTRAPKMPWTTEEIDSIKSAKNYKEAIFFCKMINGRRSETSIANLYRKLKKDPTFLPPTAQKNKSRKSRKTTMVGTPVSVGGYQLSTQNNKLTVRIPKGVPVSITDGYVTLG